MGDTQTKYDPNHESWSCDPIGIRNTADYRNDQITAGDDHGAGELRGFVEVEPWIKNCSHIGENCMTTKCCSYSGYKCYQQNENWASCLQKCFPGKWNGGVNDKPMLQPGKPLSNPPSHWNMTFSMAPPGPWTCNRLSQPMKAGTLVGSSLFCFTVALTNNGGKNWVNLPLFLNVWKMIRQQTTWKSWPWIVKSDPPAVFIPQRLREV